jgi:ABC-type phosphate transport system permease subunit
MFYILMKSVWLCLWGIFINLRMGLYIEVYGPETHVTDIVRMALEK